MSKQVETVRKEIERNANQQIQKERDEQTKTNKEWQVLLNAWIKYAEDLKKIITTLGPLIAKVENFNPPESLAIELPAKQKVSISVPAGQLTRPSQAPKTTIVNRVNAQSSDGLSGPEQRVLNALAWCESIGQMNPPNELWHSSLGIATSDPRGIPIRVAI